MTLISKTLDALVRRKLTEHKSLRDSNRKLVLSIWRDELFKLTGKTATEELTWHDFRNAYYKPKVLSDADAISRASRRLQEVNPNLRGEEWAHRQHKSQPKVKQEMIDYKK